MVALVVVVVVVVVVIINNNESKQSLSTVHSHDIHDKSDTVIPAGCYLLQSILQTHLY